MKIIKQGEVSLPKKLRGKCYKCGCIFEVDETEAIWEEDRNMNYPVWDKSCPTPECNNSHIYLYEQDRWKDRKLGD